jgi:Leucine-rich repeat (LRR) protein
LDLSFNNIVKLSPRIGELAQLQQLWLNDNPLREVPLELAQCHKLKVKLPSQHRGIIDELMNMI